jgi:hypothetical protein
MTKSNEKNQSKRDKIKGVAYLAGYEAAAAREMTVRRIRWRDSRMYIVQEAIDEDFAVAILDSVGFVIHEDREKVVLAGDLLERDVRRVLVIPKENIVSSEIQ